MEQRNDGEKRWRISPGWLIQIELVWLLLAGVGGWLMGDLPDSNWAAIAYRNLTGGNILGLFLLGNAVGYLLYEEVNMVLARMHTEEVIAKAVAKATAEAAAEAAAKASAEVEAKAAERAARERRAIAAWYERLKQAEREGRPFDEPPPGYVNGGSGDDSLC